LFRLGAEERLSPFFIKKPPFLTFVRQKEEKKKSLADKNGPRKTCVARQNFSPFFCHKFCFTRMILALLPQRLPAKKRCVRATLFLNEEKREKFY